ncbi:hypothetical protein BGZ51_008775 [Haplosporangium sp. Z 767]|nr:hypothetical protein BGZ51_008775 [Haplosporangium sp. Z 767]
MAQLTAVINRKAFLSNVAFPALRLYSPWKPGTTAQTIVRSYSKKSKSKLQIETSELEREIKRLERTIEEQEQKIAAKGAYEVSARGAKGRSEAAHSVYKSITSPIAPTTTAALTKQVPVGSPFAQSYLPETFLQDLKLTFVDTRVAKGDTVKQLQAGLPTNEELLAAMDGQKTEQNELESVKGRSEKLEMAAAEGDADSDSLEHFRELGVDKWNQLIYVNALERNWRNAEQAMQLMEEVGVEPNMDSFNYLMEAYANTGERKKAEETIELMIKNGLVPSKSAYTSLMKIHVRQRNITSAFHVLEALKAYHNPDVDVFTTLIKGCLRAREYDLGWKVFDQMQRSGATPVESTYSIMIHACAKSDQVEKALDIFRMYPTRKLQPTDATFNGLIHACAMRPEYFATAFALLNEMQNVYGFEPDITTYNTLLFACSKRRDLLTARRIFQKIVQLDSEGVLKLDGITITNFMWCVTEWKDTDVHLRNYKYKLRTGGARAQIVSAQDPSELPSAGATTSTPTSVELSVRPNYFLLPEKPPTNETEALAEGESVYAWFLSRAGNQVESTEEQEERDPINAIIQDNQRDSNDQILSCTPSPSPIHTRLLNSYLTMNVRHNEIDKATEIYRTYFDLYKRERDSWTYSIMLEGCYNWKNVDLGAEVFRNWRDWRKSTGKLTEKRTRKADFRCYQRMINLLARTDHLDESLALLEELSIAATPTNTRLRSEIESAATASSQSTYSTTSSEPSSGSLTTASDSSGSLSFLKPMANQAVLPIYPKLKDFPVVYTKTWELEDEGARKLLLRLCRSHGTDTSSGDKDRDHGAVNGAADGKHGSSYSYSPDYQDKRRARYEKSLRNTSIKWKGEHPQEKGYFVGGRRIRELERDPSKRGQDQRRPKS